MMQQLTARHRFGPGEREPDVVEQLLRNDQEIPIHPLHFPNDSEHAVIYTATGDILFFAHPLVVNDAEIDRLIAVAQEAVEAMLGT